MDIIIAGHPWINKFYIIEYILNRNYDFTVIDNLEFEIGKSNVIVVVSRAGLIETVKFASEFKNKCIDNDMFHLIVDIEIGENLEKIKRLILQKIK